MEKIRVLIADDHPLFRKGVLAALSTEERLEIVGEAIDGQQAIQMADALQPDVILMDIQLGGMNGIEATRQILNTSPHIQILALTMFNNDETLFAAMRVGMRGYLLKGADQEEMIRAIQSAHNGEAIFSPAIANQVIRYFSEPKPQLGADLFPELTSREREILTMIAQGQNNMQIAERLDLAPKTVRNHVSNIFNKLQVADRAQAIIRAREAGLR
jgi:DNA-binding NarL/FixJ family response regulator